MVNASSLIQEPSKCFFVNVIMNYPPGILGAGVLIATLNTIFTPLALLGNTAIILAILKTPSLQNPSNFLICCLAVADLITGLLCQPLYAIFKIAEFYKSYGTVCIAYVSSTIVGWSVSSVSCATLCMIAIERYLALHFHLRYQQIVSIKKLIAPVIVCWAFFIALSTSRFYTKSTVQFTWIAMTILILIFSITFWCYGSVFQIVRRHRCQIESHAQPSSGQDQSHLTDRRQFARYRKSTFTMIIILGCFLLAYVPVLFAQVALQIVGYVYVTKITHEFSATLVFINASINPIVYCLRMEHLRRACIKLVPFCRKKKRREFAVGSTWTGHPRSKIIHVKGRLDHSIGDL